MLCRSGKMDLVVFLTMVLFHLIATIKSQRVRVSCDGFSGYACPGWSPGDTLCCGPSRRTYLWCASNAFGGSVLRKATCPGALVCAMYTDDECTISDRCEREGVCSR